MASLRAKFRLFRGFLDGEAAFTGPPWVILEVTRRCNTYCAGCYGRGNLDQAGDGDIFNPPQVSPALVDRICRELPPLGAREIFLAGRGEPLLHPQVFDFIRALKAAGFRVHMFTNGILLDERIAAKIVESPLDDLRVSIWAMDSQEYATLHPGTNPSHRERKIEGLYRVLRLRRALGKALPSVHLHALLNRVNLTGIAERVRTASDSGCDSLVFGYYRHFGREYEHLCLLPEDAPKLDEALAQARDALRASRIGENVDEYRTLLSLGSETWRRLPCYSGWLQANIMADGKVYPCSHCDMVVGDLNSQSFAEIWNGERFREFRRRVSRPGGAAVFGDRCECKDCCQMKDNLRVHRVFRWIAPAVRRTRAFRKEEA